jgi:hypothetical protein
LRAGSGEREKVFGLGGGVQRRFCECWGRLGEQAGFYARQPLFQCALKLIEHRYLPRFVVGPFDDNRSHVLLQDSRGLNVFLFDGPEPEDFLRCLLSVGHLGGLGLLDLGRELVGRSPDLVQFLLRELGV